MSAKKLFLLAVTTSLGLAGILAPSCFADQTYTDTYTSVSGQYGAKVGSTYYRYSNYSGNIPMELITGSGQTAKYLYGVAVTVPINVRQQAYSYWYQASFTLSQNSTNYNSIGNVFKTSAPIEATVFFADQTTEVSNDCALGAPSDLSVEIFCEFTSTKVPTKMYVTYGVVGSFSDSDYVGWYSYAFNNGSIRITDSHVKVVEYSSEESATVGAIGNIGDTMQDIHDEELNTINDSVGDASDSADSMDTSGFNVFFPFAPWFNGFTNSNCVSIPILASWLNSNETTVCTPWNNEVRYYLTPVISILSTTVVFGLIVNWLKNTGVS